MQGRRGIKLTPRPEKTTLKSPSHIRVKRQPHTMVKDTQTVRWQQPTNCLGVFDHFLRWALKGLSFKVRILKEDKADSQIFLSILAKDCSTNQFLV